MSRYTKPTTATELEQLIQRIIQKNQDVVGETAHLIIGSEECIGGAALTKDLRNKFDFENVLAKNDIDPSHPLYSLMGPITIKHVTAQGYLVGQDYGTPFYLILYRGEKDELRGYIPKKGNAINPFTGMTFGEGDDLDDQVAQQLGHADYNSMDYSNPAIQAQFYDKTLLANDIENRIQLKP